MTRDLLACPRCQGKGYIEAYQHVEQGECFLCRGSGRDPNPLPRIAHRLQELREEYRRLNWDIAKQQGDIPTLKARLREVIKEGTRLRKVYDQLPSAS